jgi:hypothetical protein
MTMRLPARRDYEAAGDAGGSVGTAGIVGTAIDASGLGHASGEVTASGEVMAAGDSTAGIVAAGEPIGGSVISGLGHSVAAGMVGIGIGDAAGDAAGLWAITGTTARAEIASSPTASPVPIDERLLFICHSPFVSAATVTLRPRIL